MDDNPSQRAAGAGSDLHPPAGVRGKLHAVARFAASRAALAKHEGQSALNGILKAFIFGVLALGMALTTYILAILLLIILLAEHMGMTPLSAIGLVALVSLAMAALSGVLAWRCVARPFFQHLTEQLKKDREWLGHTGTDRT